MVKFFFMVVYYSLFRWFVQSDIVDCINSCSRLYSPLPESVVVNCMIRVSYKEKTTLIVGVIGLGTSFLPRGTNLLLSGSSNQFITADLDWHIQIVQYLL